MLCSMRTTTTDRPAPAATARRVLAASALALLAALATACAAQASQEPAPTAAGFLARTSPQHLRVATWNVGANTIFSTTGPAGSRAASFGRVMLAVDPDVLCINEIYPPYAGEDLGRLLDAALPLGRDRRWLVFGQPDNYIASRFPLSDTVYQSDLYPNNRQRGHAVARVLLPREIGSGKLDVVCTHMQSQGGEANQGARLQHAGRLVSLLRERHGGESVPLVIMGDLNAYADDGPRQLEVLRGATEPPLTDALPAHNGRGELRWTWRDDPSGFAPGTLDHIFYSGGTLEAGRSFVLVADELSPDELARTGLQALDTSRVPTHPDHQPVAIDLALRKANDR